VKLAFMFKALRVTRDNSPTTAYRFLCAFRAAKDTAGNEMQRPVAAAEHGINGHPLLIEPHSVREVRPGVIIETGINSTVRHAPTLAPMAKSVL